MRATRRTEHTHAQVTQLRKQFGLERLVLVGDREMISHKAIDTLRSLDGLPGSRRSRARRIRALVQGGELQLGLFDERNLFEFSHPDFPNERLMALCNVDLGKLRTHKREALLERPRRELEKVRARIENGSLAGREKSALGRQGPQQVTKSATLCITIEESDFKFPSAREADRRRSGARWLYVIRTSVPKKQMSSAEACAVTKRSPKSSGVRSMKTIDLQYPSDPHHLEGPA